MSRSCVWCGAAFESSGSVKPQRYCTRKCAQASWFKRKTMGVAEVVPISPDGRDLGICPADRNECQHCQCRHNLQCGFDDAEPGCALAMASVGSMSFDAIGAALGLTQERVRQITADALSKVRRGTSPGHRVLTMIHQEAE